MTDNENMALVQKLLDIEEIKHLKARYFRTLDHKDWEGLGNVFSERAVLEVPEADMVVEGRDGIVASVRAALNGTRTVHHGHMPEIEVVGKDRAIGTWAMFDYVEWVPDETGRRIGVTGYGHYVDNYVREDSGWHISATRLERLRVDPLGQAPHPVGPPPKVENAGEQ